MEDENHISTTPTADAVAPAPAPNAPQQLAPVQKLSLSEILNESWELFQKKAWTVLGITLMMSVVMVLVVLAVGIPALVVIGASFLIKIPALTVTLIGLAIIAGIIALSWVASWQLIATIQAFSADSSQTVLELLNKSKAQARVLLPITIATFLVMLGGMVLVIPAIVMMISLSFVSIIAVLEGKGLWESFTASRDLVRGRWWNLFFTLVGFALITIIAVLISGASYSPLLIVMTPFYYGLLYVLYKKLKSLPPAVAPTTRGNWYYKLAAIVAVIIIAGSIIGVAIGVGSSWEGFREKFETESTDCASGDYVGCRYNSPVDDSYFEDDVYYDNSSMEIIE